MGFGGYSALNYLMKVKEYSFVEAAETFTGQTMADWKPPPPAIKKDEPKVLLLPPKNKNCDRVAEYLFGVCGFPARCQPRCGCSHDGMGYIGEPVFILHTGRIYSKIRLQTAS